jgi:hypothetical protein
MVGCHDIKQNLKLSLCTNSLESSKVIRRRIAGSSSEDSKGCSASIKKINVVRDCRVTQLIKRLIN